MLLAWLGAHCWSYAQTHAGKVIAIKGKSITLASNKAIKRRYSDVSSGEHHGKGLERSNLEIPRLKRTWQHLLRGSGRVSLDGDLQTTPTIKSR